MIGPLFATLSNGFLSTLSLRRATNINGSVTTSDVISIHALLAESDTSGAKTIVTEVDFYPRSPCGERRYPTLFDDLQVPISIHALLAESDLVGVGGRGVNVGISIHALLAESDDVACGNWHKLCDFYPRSPCGERLISMAPLLLRIPFLSTLSLRRATNVLTCSAGSVC